MFPSAYPNQEMMTHSSILAWEIPWIQVPSGLQFMGSQRVGHDWATEYPNQCQLVKIINYAADFINS